MKLKWLLLSLFVSGINFLAQAEDCTDGKFKGAALKVVQSAYAEAFAQESGMAARRQELVGLLAAEPTCVGRNSINFVIAMIDINEGTLGEATAALPVILNSSIPEARKIGAVDRVIDRLYLAHDYPSALALARRTREMFPDAEWIERELALLLAFTGEYEEAKSIADKQYEASLKAVPAKVVPYEAWISLAVAELAGDAVSRSEILSKLSAHLGKDAEPVVTEGISGGIVAMVMAREFSLDSLSQPSAPPRPSYPQSAAERGIEGDCQTYFDVSAEGVPEHIVAVCTDNSFVEIAERAIAEVKFDPYVVNGVPARRVSITYPLSFRLGP
nr:energy transducer TonB [uncultured Hyphomonas sp.]